MCFSYGIILWQYQYTLNKMYDYYYVIFNVGKMYYK